MSFTKNDTSNDNLKIALNIASVICNLFTIVVLILKLKQSQEGKE